MADSSTYADGFRMETADCVISTGRPITEVSKELGPNGKTVQRRVKKRRDQLGGNVPAKQESDELKAARKRMRELEMENDLLEKASALFARSQAWAGATCRS